LVAALMHEIVLIPEGVSDVAWFEALQTALELRQGWDDAQTGQSRFSTFVGVVPTIDAKIADTFAIITNVHARPCILLDGDPAGRGYFEALRASDHAPRCVMFWPRNWAMEHVVSWIAAADQANALTALGAALGETFATEQEMTTFLLTNKSYAPTHESVAVTLMANPACRNRAAKMLGALCDVLRDPGNATPDLFVRIPADSTATMQVFRFEP
jgi:hypothetical protein